MTHTKKSELKRLVKPNRTQMEYLKLIHLEYKGVSINWEEGEIYLHYNSEGSIELKCTEIQKHYIESHVIYILKYLNGTLIIQWRTKGDWGSIEFNINSEIELNNIREQFSGAEFQSEIPFIYKSK